MADRNDLDRLSERLSERRDSTFGIRNNDPLAELDARLSGRRLGGRGALVNDDDEIPLYRRAFSGAVRGLAGALEPFQAPGDVFQALVAGGIDPDTTMMDRLRRLDPASYIPFGRAPTRATTGYEVMDLMGVENENAKRWGGVVFDFTADPLLAGIYLRIGGRLARSNSLVKMGDNIERAMSIQGINQAANRIPGKKWLDSRASDVFDTFANARVFWSSVEEPLTYGDYLLSRTSALGRQFGSDVVRDPKTQQWVRVDPETGATVENFGKRLFKGQAAARQRGQNVADRALSIVEGAERGVLGDDALPWFKKANDIITQGRSKAERVASGMPSNLRDTIFTMGYDVGDQIGFATRSSYNMSRTPPELMREFVQTAGTSGLSKEQGAVLRAARKRVAKVAKESNFDPNEAVRRFNQFTEKIIEADALLGYHLSGYEHIRSLFMRRLSQVGVDMDDAVDMWTDLVRRGMSAGDGDDLMKLETLTRPRGQQFQIREAFSGQTTLGGSTFKTLGDLLDAETSFRGLNVTDYLRNLKQGHMRRSFGLFQDQQSFRNYLSNVRQGRILSTNIIDDTHVAKAFKDDEQVAGAYRRYMENIEPLQVGRGKARTTPKERGVVVRQTDLASGIRDQLINEGVPAAEATRRTQKAVKGLVSELQAGGDNSAIARLLDDVEQVAAAHQQPPTQAVRFGAGKAFATQRQDLTRETLEKLGELSIPQVSLQEGARAARSQVAWSDFITDSYREAVRRGYVTTGPHTKEGVRFKPVGEAADLYGPFAGTHVHPYLKKEIWRAMRQRKGGGNFGRMRSLITGGYLASPNVITANLFGGVYTTSLMGISPTDMMGELGRTFREFRKASQDPNYVFQALDDLKRWVSIDDTTLIDANIEQVFKKLGRDMDANSVQSMFDEFTRFFQGQLDAPLGQKWAGLDGFQFVENWMKVSAFQARRAQLARRAGVSLDEFKKVFDARSPAARKIEAEAAEAARVAVFDYSDIPETLAVLRNTGLLLFPSFPYFLTARTARAAVQRPGAVATADRMADAINSAQMDDDTKRAVYASMPEWLREEQGVVMPFSTWEDENGDVRRSVIPFNQLTPTSTLLGNPWAESLFSGGIYKPFIELGSAFFITQDGQAPFSAKFGQQVYEQGLSRPQQIAQGMGFLTNTLAPGVARKVASYSPGSGFSGLGPQVYDTLREAAVPMEGPLADSIYNLWEVENRRADRRLWDQAVAATVRSPHVVTTSGYLANYRKNLAASQFALGEELQVLREKRDRALLRGANHLARRLQDRIGRRREEWEREMRPVIEAVQANEE